MAPRNCGNSIGGALVVRDLKAAKKPYSAPSFEVVNASAAKAKLEATGQLEDDNARQMLTVLSQSPNGKPSPCLPDYEPPRRKSN